jgi:hypothetical protein
MTFLLFMIASLGNLFLGYFTAVLLGLASPGSSK